MANFKDLNVWNKSIELVTKVYKIIEKFPKSETYWLSDQIKRCSVSIPSNIAEWNGRFWTKTYVQFLYISRWSLAELETQLIIAKNLWFIDIKDFDLLTELINEINKMLSWLIKSISLKPNS